MLQETARAMLRTAYIRRKQEQQCSLEKRIQQKL